MLRVIGEIQPTYIVGENVRGLLNWSGGLVFDQVQADLEAKGYQIAPLLLPACAVDAPHRRDRIWFVAHTSHEGRESNHQFKERQQYNGRRQTRSKLEPHDVYGAAANTNNTRLQRGAINGSIGEVGQESKQHITILLQSTWENFPTVAPIRIRNDGLSPGLVRCIIQGAGNAIVPRLAFEIFKSIASVATQE